MPEPSTDRTASTAAGGERLAGTGSNIVPTPSRRGDWLHLAGVGRGRRSFPSCVEAAADADDVDRAELVVALQDRQAQRRDRAARHD